MSNLVQLLAYLQRPDVREVVLQTNAAPAVRLGEELRALSPKPLSVGAVEALLAGSPFEAHVPPRDTRGDTASVEIDGVTYAVKIARSGERLQVRIARGPARARPVVDATQRAEYAPPGVTSGAIAHHGGGAIEIELDTPDRHERIEVKSPRAAASAGRAGRPPAGGLVQLLAGARQEGASDVHVMSDQPARIRVASMMREQGEPIPDASVREMLEPLLDERRREQLAERGYADLGVDLPGAGRLRVNVCRQRTGLKGCFRLVAANPPKLAELGLPEELGRVAMYHQGLVVVAGPSGHGKTTTMASLVDLFNDAKPIHIITVEEPVEILHPVKHALVSQREVGLHTESFHTALKAALREDPDVIAIGELRDRETVEMALSAAETGHLVLATMSTPSGARTIDRLIDMFPPDDQAQVRATLAGALKLVISQRLLPSIDGTRMIAAAELITGGIPLWTLIRDNKLFQLPSLLQRGRAYGMIRIDDSLAELVRRGLVAKEAARAYADDPRLLDAPPTPARAPEPAPVAKGGGFFGRRNG